MLRTDRLNDRLARIPDWKAAVPALLAALALTGCAHTGSSATHGESRKAIVLFDSCAKPSYPREDLRAEHQGVVTMSFLVNEEGTVADSKVLKSTGYPAMDEAARGAIQKCRFSPALQDGRPVAQWTQVQYVWTID
jgi:D-alanyl-D-alanine endopeptidase (penicillin-binding protein 7)